MPNVSPDIIQDIVAAISREPHLAHPQKSGRNNPATLIADFRERGVARRGYLLPAELHAIALLKNGGRLSGKMKIALESNGERIVKELTGMALSSDEPEIAVRLLFGLDGVRLPTASCILAWTLPHKWPVIDIRAWSSIVYFSKGKIEPSQPGGIKVKHWLDYVVIVNAVASELKWTPQKIDRWLYGYDKGASKPA